MAVNQCLGCCLYDTDCGCMAEHEWDCPQSDVPPPWLEDLEAEKYLLLDPSGNVSWINLDRKPNYGPVYQGAPSLSFDQILAAIGCDCVELVRTVLYGLVLVIDESGKIKDPPQEHNELASKLYAGYHAGVDDICGPAIVMALRRSGPYGEEDWHPLDAADLSRLSLFLGVKLPEK